MDWFITYLIKSAFTAACLYIFMKVLMEKESFHGYIRFLWLACFVLSAALPLMAFDTEIGDGSQLSRIKETLLPEITVEDSAAVEETGGGYGIVQTIAAIYFSGAAVTFILYVLSYARTGRIIAACRPADGRLRILFENICIENGIKASMARLFVSDSEISPFSMSGKIIIGKKDAEEAGVREILLHEMAHIDRRHSLDMFAAGLFTVMQWFNPCAWLMKKSLAEVHEYSVDKFVLDKGTEPCEYQLLLIKKAVGPRFHSIALP